MELYEKLGIAESADEDIVKQAFREKKMELQKQLGLKIRMYRNRHPLI